jgi:hypothetical protein
VTFYDGVTVLGTKPLVSGAASVSTILLPAGNRKLKAYYAGDAANAAATSNIISQTVNAQPSAGLAGGGALPATDVLLTVADFNGDGKTDLAVLVLFPPRLSILLGDGAGNFRPAFSTPLPNGAACAAVGDFNGDGIPDLALGPVGGFVTIVLGTGDGTFQSPANYPVVNNGVMDALAVGDFNGDGKADLAAADRFNGVHVLLGKGDGTFQPPVTYPPGPPAGPSSTPSQAAFVLAGDFNGDGKADLATVNYLGTVVNVMLGVGDGTFQPPITVATNLSISLAISFPSNNSLAMGDFNGDGKPDLVTGNGDVLLGNGDGTFQKPVSYLFGSAFAVSVAVGDFNGDGKTDLALADSFGAVRIVPGNGDGTFQSPVAYLPVSGPGVFSMLVGEFNGDGQTDLAVVANTSAVSFLLGTTVSVTPGAGSTPQSAIVTAPFPTPLQVTVKNGANPVISASVTFTSTHSISTGATATLSSSTAITDANGVASVTATANSTTGKYVVEASALGVSVAFDLANVPVSGIAHFPILPQFAPLGSAFPQPLQVTLTDSSGSPAAGVTVTFTAPASGASAVLSSGTAVTNTSGVASVTATANNTAGNYSVTASIGGQSAVFLLTNLQMPPAAVTLGTSSNPSAFGSPLTLIATVANPSATGRVTFFDGVAILGAKPVSSGVASFSTVVLPAGTHNLKAYYRDDANAITGTSNVLTQTVKAAAGGAFAAQAPLNARAPSVAVGDFNGDGKVDIAFPTSSGVTVLLGKGDGTFQSPVNYATTGGGGNSIVTGDFNRDGNTDLALTTNYDVAILLGNGDGSFRPAGNYGVGGALDPAINAIVVGDFNGDGKADLIVAYQNSYPVPFGGIEYSIQAGAQDFPPMYTVTGFSLLPGNGDGSFGRPVNYGTPGGATNVLAADFNGDGEPDLTVGLPLTILPGNGDGTAQAATGVTLAGIRSVYSLVSGDFNGDGKMDLAVGGVASGTNVATTWILLGKGDGTFQPAVSYPLGAAALSGDFNGDGFTDFVVAAGSHDTLGILLGKGDGTFQQGSALSAGLSLAVADFNGDGKADILTENAANGTMTVLLGAASGSSLITATLGASQSTTIGSPFPSPLQVTVVSNGIPVSGATVTFTAPSSGPSAILSSPTAVTNASGVASVTATANNAPGSYLVTASVGALPASFSLTNVPVTTSNLAFGKQATQSSTLGYPTDAAQSAVDGNTDGAFFDGSVTATNLEASPWWQVDLGAPATLNTIVVWNRTDACCVDRLSDYWVFVSNIPFLPTDTPITLQNRAGTISIHQTTAPNPSTTIRFEAILAQGRYVRVQLTGTNYLSLAEVQVFGTAVPPPTNLALGRTAIQSSTFPGYASAGAGSAVDGNTYGGFFNGSVTATNADPNAWWQVDLGASATVSSIVVWNRTDCCSDRLSDYWVFVSDTPFLPTDTPATLQNRPGTFSSHQNTWPNPVTTIAAGAQGRYVRVQLSGTNYLSLAEVQVFGTGGAPPPTNVAFNRSASQSSTFPGYASAGAAAAVDGNTDGNFFDGSVTATNADANAWWQVDLGASTAVSSVVVWNRADCCSTRLNDFWVFVSDTPFLPTDTPATLQGRPATFSSHQTTAPNPSTTIAAGAQGRYVRVQLSGTNYLSLAEVQVFGQ